MMLSRREAASQLRRAGVFELDLMLKNQEVRMLLFPPMLSPMATISLSLPQTAPVTCGRQFIQSL